MLRMSQSGRRGAIGEGLNFSGLRNEGRAGPEDVLPAVLENNDHITVLPRKEHP
ncbi:MAG: hypothetical protein WCK05_15715 [Planctomycetota bacterium]